MAGVAVRCLAAGACVAHIHARPGGVRLSLDHGWYAVAIHAIRFGAAGMLGSLTSIRSAGVPVAAVIALLDALASGSDLRMPS